MWGRKGGDDDGVEVRVEACAKDGTHCGIVDVEGEVKGVGGKDGGEGGVAGEEDGACGVNLAVAPADEVIAMVGNGQETDGGVAAHDVTALQNDVDSAATGNVGREIDMEIGSVM